MGSGSWSCLLQRAPAALAGPAGSLLRLLRSVRFILPIDTAAYQRPKWGPPVPSVNDVTRRKVRSLVAAVSFVALSFHAGPCGVRELAPAFGEGASSAGFNPGLETTAAGCLTKAGANSALHGRGRPRPNRMVTPNSSLRDKLPFSAIIMNRGSPALAHPFSRFALPAPTSDAIHHHHLDRARTGREQDFQPRTVFSHPQGTRQRPKKRRTAGASRKERTANE